MGFQPSDLLGKAWPVVRSALNGLANFLGFGGSGNATPALQDQINALHAAFAAIVQAMVYTDDREAQQMAVAANVFDDIGGAIGALGVNQQRLWYRLRYHIMPNTIQYIWDFVLHAWIWPLRQGLLTTINWNSAWFRWISVYLADDRNFTRTVQITGRDWRSKYVYPQLQFLLAPWRVAYSYEQQITTAVARHLSERGNDQTRDTVARVVYGDMSTLWAVFDGALAAWLQTDVNTYGYGADIPAYPRGASDPPPAMAPGVYEPWQNQPAEPAPPPFAPTLPAQDYVTH